LTFYVLDKEAGKVIGRGGETIKAIMAKTGAEIRVEKSEWLCQNKEIFSLPNERKIEIFGKINRFRNLVGAR
jgi:polyribonucleotide nucleotidyltransferase